MNTADPTIHVYANGRGFVVVPVSVESGGNLVEGTPATTVPLTLGRPTALNLTKAIRSARAKSEGGRDDWNEWDGERGKWWDHRLFRATVTWREDAVAIVSETTSQEFEPEFAAADIAEWMILHLKKRLN